MAGKMTKCKDCGATISKNAKTCPKCGAKQKKHKLLGWILVILGICIFLGAIGGDDSGGNSKKSSSGSTKTQQSKSSKSSYGVGEKAEFNDVIVTMTSATENSGDGFYTPEDGNVFVVCEFSIENNSKKDVSISSILCFDAYVDDYSTSMSLSAQLTSSKEQLDGTVASGKKMNGVIGYEVPSDWKELEVRFTPDFWSDKKITFVSKK